MLLCCQAAGQAQDIVLEKLDSNINSSGYDEISPVISWDGRQLFFTRVGYHEFDRTLLLEGEDVHRSAPEHYDFYLRDVYSRIAGQPIGSPASSSFNQDVWIALSENDTFRSVVHPAYPLNNALPNSVCSLTPSLREYIVLNQFFPEGGMEKGFSLVRWSGDSVWTFPQPIDIENYYTNSQGVSLTMSSDGEVLLLSLQRDSSVGDNDLYVSFRCDERLYSKPLSLGTDINSHYRETTPTLSADKHVLYFSSNRMGSNDIYFSRRLDESWTRWSRPMRFRSPINSDSDDSQPYFNQLTGYLYFSSRRDGSSDIFRARIAEPEKVEVVIRGRVLNSKTLLPEPAKIYGGSASRQHYEFTMNSKDGRFSFTASSGSDFRVEAFKAGFIGHAEVVSLSENFYRREYDITLYLDPIEVEGKITLKPVYFVRSKDFILPQSYGELDHLVGILKDHLELSIAIEGHTDSQGTRSSLQKLSEERAQAVRKYLIEHEVAAERIVARGFGADRPVNDNSTESLRAKNRRVEVKITHIDKSRK
jgi:outer membrane protein OmpA-like peptidoglycan-associated protein